MRQRNKWSIVLAALALPQLIAVAAVAEPVGQTAPVRHKHHKAPIDHSGKPQHGKASFYGPGLIGKPTATGEPMDPNKPAAASKTLPLGTKAKVTNLDNGKSVEVEINDRGPYVDDRIIDVTPKAADKLGMKEDGVAPVVVKPLEVPQPNGEIKTTADTPQ
jgi:rare lipoprotein A